MRRRLVLAAILLPVTVAGIGAGGLAWRLSQGPLPVPWLAARLATALAAADESLAVTIGSATLAWDGEDGEVDLRAHDVTIDGPDQRRLAVLPTVIVRLRLGSLLVGKVAVRELEIVRPRLRVARQADGTWDLDLGDTAGDEDETPFAEMLARTVRRGGLEGVRLDEGLVEVLDVGSARRWVARHVDLRVSARDERLVGEASLVADLEGHETTLTVTASDHADATVTVHVTIADLAPSTLNGRPGPQLPGLLDGIGLTLAGTADLSLDAQLRLQRLTATFSSGAGTVTLPDEALDLAVLRAGLGVTYEAAEDATTLVDSWLETEDARLTLDGRVTECTTAPHLDATIATDTIDAAALPHYWPAHAAGAARDWFAEHVSTGTVAPLRVRVVAYAGDSDGIAVRKTHVDFRLRDATVRYADGLPPLLGASGHGTCTLDDCKADVTAGTIGALTLEPTRVNLSGLDTPSASVRVQTTAYGSAQGLLHILSAPSLGYAEALPVDPDRVGGTVQARLTVDVPLAGSRRGLKVRQASATIRGLAAPDVIGTWDVRDGDLTVALDGNVLDVQGTARLAGVPFEVSWQEPIATPRVPRHVRVKGELDRTQRRALGVDPGDWLTGPVGVTLRLDETAPTEARVVVRVDLDDSEVRLPVDALAKRAGQPGGVQAVVMTRDWQIRRITDLDGHLGPSTFTGQATRFPDDSGWATAEVEALLRPAGAGGEPSRCSLRLEPADTANRFTFTVDDLGRFLAALGTPFEARGGAFRYAGTARLDQPGLPFEGTLSADRFTLTRSTLLTRVVNLTAIMGLRHALAGDGIAFDEMHGRLSQRGGTLELQEGIAVGRVMALHLEGTWDLPQNRCDAQGDLVPSYWGLNRMVSKIPLVGALAGGATGIQAFHFRARGTASNPTVTVDPLKSLAPGALRTVLKRLVP